MIQVDIVQWLQLQEQRLELMLENCHQVMTGVSQKKPITHPCGRCPRCTRITKNFSVYRLERGASPGEVEKSSKQSASDRQLKNGIHWTDRLGFDQICDVTRYRSQEYIRAYENFCSLFGREIEQSVIEAMLYYENENNKENG